MIHVGYVKKTAQKEGTGKRGKWVLRSFIIEHDDGTESGWLSGGFDALPFAEGSYVSVETVQTDRGQNYVPGSLKILSPPSKPLTERAAPPASAPSQGAPAKTGSYVDRNDSIVYQSSRKDALAMIGLLLEHDALPLAAAGAKANTAKRFDEIKAYVDKFTIEFFNDVQTGRLLISVVDAGQIDAESVSPASDAIDND